MHYATTDSGLLYRDRTQAGGVLADALAEERSDRVVVVGLARGGVVVAAEVARRLETPLDALAVRKIRHPLQPEYAIGALTPETQYVREPAEIGESRLAWAVLRAQREADKLDRRLHGRHPALVLQDRDVIVVDDGLATGATMIAAVRWAHARGAARVVAAAPVASTHAARALRREADRVVCPVESDRFWAVGFWYAEFDEVADEEVLHLLDEASERVGARLGVSGS